MNILYDQTIFRLQRYGGISKYFCELVGKYIDSNEIHMFKGININEYDLDQYKSKFASYTSYKIPEIKYTGFITNKLNNRLFDRKYASLDTGVYHPTYYKANLAKFSKLPTVLTVHDMIYELFPENFWNSKWVIESKKASINSADAIICISENTKTDMLKFYDVPEYKISVVYMGNTPPNKIKTHQHSKPYLLFVGDRSAPYKNFWPFFEVYLKEFKDEFDLVLFGNGLSKQESKFIDDNALKNKVIQIQGDNDILWSVYENAHCLVYPSLYEGFGIPVVEAMSVGCPVVACNASSIPEVAGNAGILFNPKSAESMINAISLVKHRRQELILSGYARAEQFSWDKVAKETMDVYESLL
jgi:glycosyltransferase involved in cell wall biosynthesis